MDKGENAIENNTYYSSLSNRYQQYILQSENF